MLGKRFRRTTSMSHLGPGSPVVGMPAAEATVKKVQESTTPHSVPHKAARPLIFQAHVSEQNALEGRADVCYGDVSMAAGASGCGLVASQTQRLCQMNEGSCAVDVVCSDLNMEVMVPPGCGDQGSSNGDAIAKAGFDYSVAMVEGSQIMQAHGGGVMANSPGSLMSYQMGLWIHNSMHLSYGNGKPEKPISPVDFLDVCFLCKRRLRHERDIFIYRGDTAFCSEECRHRQIVNDERRSSRATNKRGGARASSSSETAVAA